MIAQLLLDLLSGNRPHTVTVCHVDSKIAGAMGTLKTAVILRRDRLIHILEEHKDIKADDLAFLSTAIENGLVIKERGTLPSINICYQHPRKEARRYKVNIQRIGLGELVIMSFHRTKPRQTQTLLKRGKILRNHL